MTNGDNTPASAAEPNSRTDKQEGLANPGIDLLGRIAGALKKGGYPLELRVASAAQKSNPYYVDQSAYYADPTTGKLRETDVIVCHQDIYAGVHQSYVFLVIECKHGSDPWVMFDDGGPPLDDPRLRLEWSVQTEKNLKLGDSIADRLRLSSGREQSVFRAMRMSSSVVVPFKTKDSADRAWLAVQAAVAACYGVIHDIDAAELSINEFGTLAGIGVPVVVTSGPLFRAYLGGDDEIMVEPIARGELRVRTEHSNATTRCVVLTESALPSLLEEARRTVKIIARGNH